MIHAHAWCKRCIYSRGAALWRWRLCHSVQRAGVAVQSWLIMEQQAVMFQSGQASLALSLALACAVLAAVTGNLVLALLASACMCAIVVVFLGAMQLFGWSLGAPPHA